MNNEKLFEIWVRDLQKPDIDKYERALMIREYMNRHDISAREFARRFDFPKSTIDDWLLFSRLSPTQFERLRREGWSQSEIYRLVRNNKQIEFEDLTFIDKLIDNTADKLSRSESIKFVSKHTEEKLEQLQKAINTFKFRIEKNIQK